MTEVVWILEAPTGLPKAAFAPLIDDWSSADAAQAAWDKNRGCIPLLPEEYPKRLVSFEEINEHEEDFIEAGLTPPRSKKLPLPLLFHDGSFLFSSQQTADTLAHFALGKTQLHELGVFAGDGKTSFGVSGFWINILEIHACLDVGRSDGLDSAGTARFPAHVAGTKSWLAYPESKVVITNTLPDVDLWRDPLIGNGIFLKDSLVQALKKVKGGKKLRFRPCKVVGE